jgi:hypothetical protein
VQFLDVLTANLDLGFVLTCGGQIVGKSMIEIQLSCYEIRMECVEN